MDDVVKLHKRYFAIVGSTFVVPLEEISAPDMFLIREVQERKASFAAVPVYFCPGLGVWPTPLNNCRIVAEVDPSEI